MDFVKTHYKGTEINLPVPININDNYDMIKEKIFLKDRLNFPPFIALYVDDQLLLRKNMNLLNKQLHFANIMDYISENIHPYIGSLYTDLDSLINKGLPVFNELFHQVHKIWINLDEHWFSYALKSSLYASIPTFYKFLEADIARDTVYIENKYLEIKKKYQKQKIESKTKIKASDLIDFDNDEYRYNLLHSVITIEKKESTAKLFDLVDVFKSIQLNEDIPLAVTYDHETKDELVKVHKSLPKDKIKEWLLASANTMKRSTGLMLKVRKKGSEYNTINVYDSGKISIRCSWSVEEHAKIESILPQIKKVNDMVLFLNTFIEEKANKIKSVKSLESVSINTLNFQFNIKTAFVWSNVIKVIPKFKEYLAIDLSEKKHTKALYLKYLKDNITIKIRNNMTKSDNHYHKMTSIDVAGVRNKTHIVSIVSLIVKIFQQAVKELTTNPEKVVMINIKALKKEGAKVNAVSCQKERQPVINQSKSNSLSYTLTYNDTKYNCPNPPFLFPGFTSKDIPCCFKKDQRKKYNYLKNQGGNEKVTKDVVLSKLIITDKILEKNRMGVLPKLLRSLLPKVVRLGIIQDDSSFLNAVCSNVTRTDLAKLSKNRFMSLNDGELCRQMTHQEFKQYLLSNFLEHDMVLDLLSRIINKKIIVFEIAGNIINISCFSSRDKGETLLVLNNGKHYEPLVNLQNNNKINHVFASTDPLISKIRKLLNESCIDTIEGFDHVLKSNKVVECLQKNSFNIIGQIVNVFNKIDYIVSDAGVLPVFPTGPLENMEIVKLNDSDKLSLKKQMSALAKLNLKYLNPSSQIIDENGMVTGLVTKEKLLIPIKKSKHTLDLPHTFESYENVNDLIANSGIDVDLRGKYMQEISIITELYERIRFEVAGYLYQNENEKEKISAILKSKIPPMKMKDEIKSFLKEVLNNISYSSNYPNELIPKKRALCKGLQTGDCRQRFFCGIFNGSCKLKILEKFHNFMLDKLTTEFLEQPNDILKNKIKSDVHFTSGFAIRDSEIILHGLQNFLKFLN